MTDLYPQCTASMGCFEHNVDLGIRYREIDRQDKIKLFYVVFNNDSILVVGARSQTSLPNWATELKL